MSGEIITQPYHALFCEASVLLLCSVEESKPLSMSSVAQTQMHAG